MKIVKLQNEKFDSSQETKEVKADDSAPFFVCPFCEKQIPKLPKDHVLMEDVDTHSIWRVFACPDCGYTILNRLD